MTTAAVMLAKDNQWLKVKPGVVLTPIIEPVIVGLDRKFSQAKKEAWITSGKRDPAGQLRVIVDLALQHLLGNEFDFLGSMTLETTTEFEGQPVLAWRVVWSRLLNLGVIVNPPEKSKTLMDYNRVDEASGHLVLYKPPGYEIDASDHFLGTCADIGGGDNGISDELAIVQAALAAKDVPGLVSCVIERKNNCVHFKCEIL